MWHRDTCSSGHSKQWRHCCFLEISEQIKPNFQKFSERQTPLPCKTPLEVFMSSKTYDPHLASLLSLRVSTAQPPPNTLHVNNATWPVRECYYPQRAKCKKYSNVAIQRVFIHSNKKTTSGNSLPGGWYAFQLTAPSDRPTASSFFLISKKAIQ